MDIAFDYDQIFPAKQMSPTPLGRDPTEAALEIQQK
jgi:hypothetical protein